MAVQLSMVYNDHAELFFNIIETPDVLLLMAPSVALGKRKNKSSELLPSETYLDNLPICILDSKFSVEEALSKTYESVWVSTDPYSVYTNSSCHGKGTEHAQAGIGVYWAPATKIMLQSGYLETRQINALN